jgi:hypothetical protein
LTIPRITSIFDMLRLHLTIYSAALIAAVTFDCEKSFAEGIDKGAAGIAFNRFGLT